jgi:hypothetical protein
MVDWRLYGFRTTQRGGRGLVYAGLQAHNVGFAWGFQRLLGVIEHDEDATRRAGSPIRTNVVE